MNPSRIAKFLTGVKKHQTTEYFDTVRSEWAELKLEMVEFVTSLMHDMQEFDGGLALIDPKSTLYRINRDIRFSKDKSPYKTWMAVGITPQKKSDMKPTYYFHINHLGQLEYGSGAWGVRPEDTKVLRNAIIQHPKAFKEMIQKLTQNKLVLEEQFKKTRIPNGYPKYHELSEYLKYSSFAVGGPTVDITDWSDTKIQKYLLKFYQKTAPLVLWARQAIKNQTTNA
jgi:uncharacterized protein (TIGR02453 family)